MTPSSSLRFGITVMPEYIQSESIDGVLDRLISMGATAVTTSPYVAEECKPEDGGSREPPSDAGAGKERLLERPLWGKSEVWMRTAPSFVPDTTRYQDTPYTPDSATSLTHAEGGIVSAFLLTAKERGLTTYLQVMAAIPPAYRVQFGGPVPADQPIMASGEAVGPRVDNNATLASAGLRNYMRGLINDLCAAYPECDGIKFDWPEYPPYEFRSLFADYNSQVAPYASEIGLDLDELSKSVLEACKDQELFMNLDASMPFEDVFKSLCEQRAAVADHFRLRRHLTKRYAEFLKQSVAEASNGSKLVCFQGFPPPWHLLSGFDPSAFGDIADHVAAKFYTMHWPMIGANYVSQIAEAPFGFNKDQAAAYFRRHFLGQTYTAPLAYPDPDTPHGIDAATIKHKMRQLKSELDSIGGIAHAYGPKGDVASRFSALLEASGGHIELNRYAYLSDEKIAAIAKITETYSKRH